MTTETKQFEIQYHVGHWMTRKASKVRALMAKTGCKAYRATYVNGKIVARIEIV